MYIYVYMKLEKLYLIILILFITACENNKDKKLLGQIIGTALGGYLGSKVGSGVTQDLSIILGGAAGYILGGKIIEILNQEEKNDFNNVIEDSLNYNSDNSIREWESSSNKNISGEVIPLNSYQINEKNCRDFKKIIKKDQEIFEEKSTACRSDDGNWVLI